MKIHNINTVYLDLDDTLVDLQGPLFDLLGVPHSRISELHTYKNSLPGISGLSRDEIIRRWVSAGPKFWNDLEWTDLGRAIWDAVHFWKGLLYRDMESMIVTALPSGDGTELTRRFRDVTSSGKLLWFEKHFGPEFENFSLCNAKGIHGNPDSLLIDDRNEYVKAFQDRDGMTVQVPQPWNSASGDVISKIKAYLDPGTF